MKSVIEDNVNNFYAKLEKYKKPLHLPEFINMCYRNSDISTQVFAHNFCREVIFNNINIADHIKIGIAFDNHIEGKKGSSGGNDLVNNISDFTRTLDPKLYFGNSVIDKKANNELSNFRLEDDFWVYFLGFDFDDSEAEKELFFNTLMLSGYHEALESVNILEADKEIGNRRNRFWIAVSDEIEDLKYTPNAADTIRNNLGLWHFSEGENLLEIKFPASFLNNILVPTIYDGDLDYSYFQPQKEEDGWGRSIDLCTLQKSKYEAIHSSHILPESSKCYNRLGRITSDPPHLEINIWIDYINRSESNLEKHCTIIP
jgi:hypothetical protein